MKNKSGTSKTDTIIDEIQNNIKELTKCINQLIIEQNKLKKALNRQSCQQQQPVQTECTTRSHIGATKKQLKIGDRIGINSSHKNRKGNIGHIKSFRGSTQEVITSSQEAEGFAVWKNNISIINNKSNNI